MIDVCYHGVKLISYTQKTVYEQSVYVIIQEVRSYSNASYLIFAYTKEFKGPPIVKI